MTNRILIAFLLINVSTFNAQDVGDIVRKDFNSFKKIFNYGEKVKLKITDTGKTASYKSGLVTISKNQIEKIKNNFEEGKELFLLRFIIAHEMAHQYQFAVYKYKPEYFDDSEQARMLLEAQADIIAGYMWMYLNSNEAYYEQNIDATYEDALNFFRTVISLGIDENAFGTHPSSNDRIMLLREGIVFGAIHFIEDRIRLNPSDIIEQHGSIEYVQDLVQKEFVNLDFRKESGETIQDWSFKTAKRILNFDPKISKNLILNTLTPDKVVWHTSDENYPFVDYDLHYTNIGKEELNVDMQVYLAHVKRSHPNSSEYHRRRNINKYSFIIRPGETKNIKGSLRWDKSTDDPSETTNLPDDYFPRLVFPNYDSRDAFISCSYSSDTKKSNLSSKEIQMLSLFNSSELSKYDLATYLQELIRGFRFDIENLKVGIGNLRYNPQFGNFVQYNSIIPFDPGSSLAIRSYIEENSTFSNLKYDLNDISIQYEYENKQDALSQFNYLISICDLALTDYEKDDSNQIKYPNEISYYYNDNEVIVDVKLTQQRNEKEQNYWLLELLISD